MRFRFHSEEEMLEFDDEEVFPVAGVAADAFVRREFRARAQVVGGPAAGVGRWLAWLRGVWWRVDPRLHHGRLQVRLALWRARVDWPLFRRGLSAFARSFLFMVLLVLREEGYHFLPQITIPFELPRDSYVRRLQSTFRFCMIKAFKALCAMNGASGVIAALLGLGIDVGRWRALDFFGLTLEGAADQDHDLAAPALPQNALRIRLGDGYELVIPERIRGVPLVAVIVLMLAVVFLFDPTAEDQEPAPT